MEKGLDFNSFKNTNNPKKAIVALHGWSGNKNSFMPFAKNSKLNNLEWFLPEAPYIEIELPCDLNSFINLKRLSLCL